MTTFFRGMVAITNVPNLLDPVVWLFVISNRNLCFDHVIVSLYTVVRGIQKTSRRQRLNVCVNIAVVAPKSLRQRPDTPHLVPPDIV